MSDRRWVSLAEMLLARHGHAAAGVTYLGAGAQSSCYGTREVAVLLSRSGVDDMVRDLTGHALPVDGETVTCNGYAVLQWASGRAADAGMRTPRILAVGESPRPYALVERASGVVASAHPRLEDCATRWFGQFGWEIRKSHRVETTGFGFFVPDGAGGYRGQFATWADFLNRWGAHYLNIGGSRSQDEHVLDFMLGQGIATANDFGKVAAKIREAKDWPVRSVLTHYDNRAENLVVGPAGITVLDWGLSLAGIGISQELIKLFETEPTSTKSPRVAAFLHGYGLSPAECEEAVERGKLMLVLDGLAMSYGWADDPDRLEGVRAWLRTVKRICDTW